MKEKKDVRSFPELDVSAVHPTTTPHRAMTYVCAGITLTLAFPSFRRTEASLPTSIVICTYREGKCL